ncbi:MAG: type III-A CRISPR-associated RAMP protein Csm3 [Anaerolineae bacterium]
MSQKIQLTGRIFLTFDILTKSGLHIGGSDEGIGIGGVDKTVIRDTITNQPYIPGSSLRGKVRSLTEKYTGLKQNSSIGSNVSIHSCTDPDEYANCDVCQIYGVSGKDKFSTPTRLIVRDVQMSDESVKKLRDLRTDLPFTESKTEVAIDRVTSAASPRQMERVPAGVAFGAAEMVYSLYDGAGCDSQSDLERFKTVITGLQLLEDDYLGGLGSRGSGKVELVNIKVEVKAAASYDQRSETGNYETLQALVNDYDALKSRLAAAL